MHSRYGVLAKPGRLLMRWSETGHRAVTRMKLLKICTLTVASLLPWGEASAGGHKLDQQEFDVFAHGRLVMEVPADWQTQYVTYNDLTPPTLHVNAENSSGFDLSVTIYWHDGLDHNLVSAESLRRLVEKVGHETIALSVQKQLKVEPIRGLGQPGFLFNLTDSEARQGEFHFVTQGAMAVGNLVLAFTLLTERHPSEEWSACLKMLKSARHIPARQSVSSYQLIVLQPQLL